MRTKKVIVCMLALIMVLSTGGCKKGDKGIELRVITLRNYQEQVTDAAEYFMAKHEGSKITVETLSDVAETRSSEIQKLKTETMAGKGADVFILEGEDPNYVEESRPETLFSNIAKTMESGAFASLDTYMEKDSYWGKGTYKKEFLTAGQYDGRQYVIPMSCSYYAFASTAEGEKMTGTTTEDWLLQAEVSGDEALGRTIAGSGWIMSGGLMQPAVDYQSKKVLFDVERWCQFYEKMLPLYQGYTIDYEGTQTCLLGRITDVIHYSIEGAGGGTFQPVPTLEGKKLAIIKGYGAVGMSCENKEMAYEFLMLLLNDKIAEEKEVATVTATGMIGMDGVPVQESAWKYSFGNLGVFDEGMRTAILESFRELEGAYFATPVENMITNATIETFSLSADMSEEQLRQNLEKVAQQAEEQYETMVKE